MMIAMDSESLARITFGLYLAIIGLVCIYGLHRYHLVHLYHKYRSNVPKLTACFRELPKVTIQLPMFNEAAVARRVIDSTCAVDYPKDRLQIQVLDDSTDETVDVVREAVEYWRSRGYDIEQLHRDNRTGYKAGALAEGLKVATGEFVLIFDADFVPTPDILRETIHYFVDPRVGMVQARWEHLNRNQSLLTRGEAILLDGHFLLEHGARNRSGRFMGFNGTAGLWRRSCIDDAGGWQHDTLTEDLDLSYRAQMKGWRFLFLPDLTSPGELPPDMEAFKQQQHRWAKGGAQTCRKLLPTLLRAKLPWRIKLEGFFHLTNCMIYVLVLILTLLLFPVVHMKVNAFDGASWWQKYAFDASILLLATFSGSTFYATSQRILLRSWADSLKYLPFLMILGVGICLNNARAVLEGFFGKPGEFVRTQKFGTMTGSVEWKRKIAEQRNKQKGRIRWQPFAELGVGLYLMVCLILSLQDYRVTIGTPFLALFMVGYLYVPLMTWFGHRLGRVDATGQEAELAVDTVRVD